MLIWRCSCHFGVCLGAAAILAEKESWPVMRERIIERRLVSRNESNGHPPG